jgi:hypothetical protein
MSALLATVLFGCGGSQASGLTCGALGNYSSSEPAEVNHFVDGAYRPLYSRILSDLQLRGSQTLALITVDELLIQCRLHDNSFKPLRAVETFVSQNVANPAVASDKLDSQLSGLGISPPSSGP